MEIATRVWLMIAGVAASAGEIAPILSVRHEWEAVSATFSPDGKILAAGSGHTGIILWDSASGKELRRIFGKDVGDSIAFAPDGKTLAAARIWRADEEAGNIDLWEVGTGKRCRRLRADGNLVRCIAFSPDGKLLVAHSQWGLHQRGAVRVWDVGAGKEILKIPTNSAGHTIAISPDGKLLAFDVEYTVRLCETATGKELFKLEGHQEVGAPGAATSGYLNAVTFSRDGKLLASASCDNMARIWEVATGKALHVLEGHRGFVNAIAFFPDGKRIVTGGEDGTMRVWDVATGEQLLEIQAHGVGNRQDGDRRKDVFALSFSPDGKRLVSGGRDTAVKLWDGSTIIKQSLR